MFERLTKFSIKYRIPIIIAFVGLSLFFASKIRLLEIDTDIKSQLPDNMPAKVRSDKIEEMFGGTEVVVVSLSTDNILNKETLQRVKDLSKEFKKIKGVDRIMSLSETNDIRARKGELLITPFLKRLPRSEKAMEELKEYIVSNDMVYGNIVSKDFEATAITLILENDIKDDVIIGAIKEVISKYPGKETVDIAGLPYVRSVSSKYMKGDMRKFMPIGLAIMLVFLYLCFKELRGVVLPFLVVILSIFIAMGSIYFFGWKIQLVTIILPVILIAIANDYGIHLISEYQMLIKEEPDKSENEIIADVMKSLSGPVLVAGITTIVGMLGLLSHIIVPAKQLGVLAAIGIAFALLASLLLVPAILSLLPKSKIRTYRGNGKSFLERRLESTSRYIGRNPKRILIGSLVVFATLGIGIKRIIIDTNPINYYSKKSPIVKSDNLINEKFGGSTTISIVATGDMKDINIMKQISDFDSKLSARERVGSVNSIADIMKKMNKSLNDGDESYDKLPDTSRALSEYFLLYSMSGNPEDLEKLVDFNYENALITERISSASAKEVKDELEAINKEIKMGKGHSPFTIIGGFGDILSELVTATVNGQLISLFVSLIIVGITVGVFFKSPIAGFLSSLPIAFALVILFGLMGYTGVELNIITALLTSIMIGVGVDYSIHFLWRFKKLKEEGNDEREAVYKTLTSIGRGIIFNALSVVIGFLALMVSNFMPIKFFGFLIVVSISTCLFAALFILPALCIVFKPFSKNKAL